MLTMPTVSFEVQTRRGVCEFWPLRLTLAEEATLVHGVLLLGRTGRPWTYVFRLPGIQPGVEPGVILLQHPEVPRSHEKRVVAAASGAGSHEPHASLKIRTHGGLFEIQPRWLETGPTVTLHGMLLLPEGPRKGWLNLPGMLNADKPRTILLQVRRFAPEDKN